MKNTKIGICDNRQDRKSENKSILAASSGSFNGNANSCEEVLQGLSAISQSGFLSLQSTKLTSCFNNQQCLHHLTGWRKERKSKDLTKALLLMLI